MASKTVSIQLSNGKLRLIDQMCEHYRWKRSHAVGEFIDFYLRLQSACQEYQLTADGFGLVVVDDDGGYCGDLNDGNSLSHFAWFIREVNKGLLSAFRAPVDFTEEVPEKEEEIELVEVDESRNAKKGKK